MSETHLSEMLYKPGTLERAIHEATKNVVIWEDIPGTARIDWPATTAARNKIAAEVRWEFTAGKLHETENGYADHTSAGTAADMAVDRSWEW
jgi:hypothetical protein